MANTIKGLTVEIGGDTTKLGKALEDVNTKSKNLSSELGQINKMLKLDPGNTELLAQKQKVLADAIANTGKKLDTLKAAEKQVQEQFKKGEVSEEQVRELQREIIATEKRMDSYAKAAEEVEKALRGAGDGADEMGDDLDKAGEDADEAEEDVDDLEKSTDKLDSTMGKVAKAGLAACAAGLAALSAAAVAAGKALIDMSVGGAQYADTVLTESTVTGIATDKLQEYMYAAELVDVSTDTLTKSMGKNIKSMKAVQDGTKLSVDAYKKLGVEVLNADGSLRDGQTVYWETIDALGKIENETERDALAMQVLGKSAQELNPLIEAGSEKMNELGEQAHEAGYVMSEETLEAFGKFDDQLQYLKVGAEGAKNALGTVLLPMLTDLAGEGVDFLGEFTRGVQNANGDVGAIADLIADLLPNVVNKILSYVPQVLTLVTSVISGIGSALVESAPMLVSSLMDIATTLLTTLTAGIPQFLTTAVQIVMAIIEGLTQAIPQVTQALVDMIPQLVNALVTGIPQLITGAVQLLMAIVQAIPQIVPPLVAALPSIVMSIINGLLTAIPQLITGAVQFLMAIVQAIPTMIQSLVTQIPTIVTTIVQGLITLVPQLLSGAMQLLQAIIQAIPLIIQQLIPMIPNIVVTIIQGLITLVPMLINGAVQLLMAIVQAIPIIIESLIPVIPTIVDTVISGLLSLLPTLLEGAVTLLTAIIEAIPLILPPLILALPDIITSIVSVLMQNIPLLIQTAIQLFLAIVQAIPQVLGSIVSGVGQIGKSILDYFGGLPSKMLDIGKDLIKGLWNGIKDMAGWVKQKISGFASDVLDGIKGFFGINSPSKETAWMGEMLDRGLAEGVLAHAKDPIKAMQKVTDGVLGAAEGDVGGIGFERQLSGIGMPGASAGVAGMDSSSLLAKLDGIYERLGRLQVVLDGRTLVGEILDPIDAGLGMKQALHARGV